MPAMSFTPSPLSTPLAVDGALFELCNRHGMRVTISEQGAAPVSWLAPDRYGRMAQVIAGARVQEQLQGLGARWHGAACEGGLTFQLTCSAGAGEPGGVIAQADYTLDDEGRLRLDYESVAAAPMPDAPGFRLNGEAGDVGDHMLRIDADYFIPLDGAERVPGTMVRVGGSAFDFRRPAAIGARLAWPDPQLLQGGGFGHCYCMAAGSLRDVARVLDPASGRQLDVATSGDLLQLRCSDALGAVSLAGLARTGRVHRHTTTYRLSVQQDWPERRRNED